MMVYAPLEYSTVERLARYKPRGLRYCHAYEIEAICAQSDNPYCHTLEYRKALIDYRRMGMNITKKAEWTLEEAVYYAKHTSAIVQNLKD